MQELNHELVSRGVLLAMERGAKERELMSIMIASFSGTGHVVTSFHRYKPTVHRDFVILHCILLLLLFPYIVFCECAGTELDREQVEAGFTLLLEGVEDNVADVPLYVSMLATFVARAVSDEALAPSFLQRVNLSVSDLGNEVIQVGQSLLSSGSRNPSRLMKIWGYVANKYVWLQGVH